MTTFYIIMGSLAVVLASAFIIWFVRRKMRGLRKIGTLFLDNGNMYLEVRNEQLRRAIQLNETINIKEGIIDIIDISQK